MFIEAITVFLALIGTTLSCINTGARVTYAMGRDEEVPTHFGILHGKNATPHRCIWTLATLSASHRNLRLCSICAVRPLRQARYQPLDGADHEHLVQGRCSTMRRRTKFPQQLLVITLISNFGTFLLYMMSCIVAMVAFHEHHMHNPIKHILIPGFGLLANLACMIFYLSVRSRWPA